MKKYTDRTEEEFEALPADKKLMAVAATGMSNGERAEMDRLDGLSKRSEEWDKRLHVLLDQPKRKSRVIVLAIVLAAIAAVVVLAVSG